MSFRKCIRFFALSLIGLIVLLLAFDEISTCFQYYRPIYLNGYMTDRIENTLDYDKNKKSVILLGCSFTYGETIYDTENFSYKLQELTHRKVYNKGNPSWGPQFVLRDIQKSDFFNNQEIVEPEYAVYTFITDHLRRIYTDYFSIDNDGIFDLYQIKNNRLVLNDEKVRFANYIKISTLVKRLNWLWFNMLSDNQKFDRLKLYIFTIKEELEKRYPGIKLVVIVYNPNADTTTHHLKPFRTERWSELEQAGIIVIRFDSPEYDFLQKEEYLSEVDYQHPGPKVWETLTPVIARKLNLLED